MKVLVCLVFASLLAEGYAQKLVCYYGSWSAYRPGSGKFSVENIDPYMCTHLIYGFSGLGQDGRIKALDPWNDLQNNNGAMRRFTDLKRLNSNLKTLVAIGGWNEGSSKYSDMASDSRSRAKFIQSVLDFIDEYNFDGLDLNWEYPASRGGRSVDKRNYVSLLSELKSAFREHDYLLSAAVAADKFTIDNSYDVPQLSRYLDMINIKSYDYHGAWESKTGLNAPLYSSPVFQKRYPEDQLLNVNFTINYWIQKGAARNKINLGLASYGRSFTLDNAGRNFIYSPASQKGRAGAYTQEPGFLGFNEICELLQDGPDSWTTKRDRYYRTPYAFTNGNQWVGYDDAVSLKEKTQFAQSLSLGGIMVWSMETDDFSGRCGQGTYPLIKAVKSQLTNDESPALVEGGMGGHHQGGGGMRGGGSHGGASCRSSEHPSRSSSPSGHREYKQTEVCPCGRTSGGSCRCNKKSQPSHTQVKVIETEEECPCKSKQTTVEPKSHSEPKSHMQCKCSTKSGGTTSCKCKTRPKTFTCSREGMFADPQKCTCFHVCTLDVSKKTYTDHKLDCGPGTAFSEKLKSCDHIANVPSCRNK